MEIRLEAKQGLAFQTQATELLYGGAAGGGKSMLLRVSAMRWCLDIPGIQVYLFRRTLPDLRDNHLRGPTSFHVLLAEHVASGHVKYRSVENEFEFWNGSILHLCYCDSENDVEKYRGAEINVLAIDELTHFSEFQYRFLRARTRIAGLKVPDQYAGDKEYAILIKRAIIDHSDELKKKIAEMEKAALERINNGSPEVFFPKLPRIETASNPGSVGHAWCKRTFINPKPPLEIWRASPEEGGMLRQFIPARLYDNPYLMKEDPQYAARLTGLGADHLVRAMLEGDWNLVAGQAFEKLRLDTHGLDPFEIPQEWGKYRSVDWGSIHPFSVGWWAVVGEDCYVHPYKGIVEGDITDSKKLRKGALIRYREWYGWSGVPDEGLRMEAADVARGIVSRSGDEKYGYTVADSSMWSIDGGPSIAETFRNHGVTMRPASKGPGSRHVGYIEVRGRIAGDDNGLMLYAFKTCHSGFWRTMPDLIVDASHYGLKSESVETNQEDHVSDETMYMCTSRPWIRTVEKAEAVRKDWFRFDKIREREIADSWRTI